MRQVLDNLRPLGTRSWTFTVNNLRSAEFLHHTGSGTCDIDGGGVGITDFLELLANWGPCP